MAALTTQIKKKKKIKKQAGQDEGAAVEALLEPIRITLQRLRFKKTKKKH